MSDTKPSTPATFRDVNTLHNWEHNPRTVTKQGLERLIKQIKKLGVYKPLLITEDGTVLGGNMRLQALQQMGEKKVWVSVVKAKTEEEKIEYALSDNDRVGKYEADQLANLIGNFPEVEWADYSVDIKEPEIVSDLMDSFKEVEEDEPPAVAEGEPESKLGEVYQLGRHRIMCGDSTKIEDVERLMDGKKADISFTSPPYNVGHNLGYKNKKSKYINSNDDLDDYIDLIVKSTQLSLDNAKDVFVNIQLLANNKRQVLLWLAELSDKFKDIFYWKKLQVQPAMAKNVANSQVEVIVLFGNDNNSRSWGNKEFRGNFSNYIETNSASRENENSKIHNATFPVGLPAKFIKHGYTENSICLDLFLGSGSTLIACEQTNRINFGLEIDPKYIDVIIKRWMKFTGQRASKIIDADGKPCNIPVKFADESFMESKTLTVNLEVKKED
jgi:DNA modification methylase